MIIQFNRAGTWQEISKQEFFELVSKGMILAETEVAFNGQKGVPRKSMELFFQASSPSCHHKYMR